MNIAEFVFSFIAGFCIVALCVAIFYNANKPAPVSEQERQRKILKRIKEKEAERKDEYRFYDFTSKRDIIIKSKWLCKNKSISHISDRFDLLSIMELEGGRVAFIYKERYNYPEYMVIKTRVEILSEGKSNLHRHFLFFKEDERKADILFYQVGLLRAPEPTTIQ